MALEPELEASLVHIKDGFLYVKSIFSPNKRHKYIKQKRFLLKKEAVKEKAFGFPK